MAVLYIFVHHAYVQGLRVHMQALKEMHQRALDLS